MFSVFSKSSRSARLKEVIATLLRNEPPAAAPSKAQPDSGTSRESLRILLAEDSIINQKVALRILAKRGYRADIAANGIEALHAIERQPYDVVLLDVEMPEMDGLEATRRICARWPREARPYLIAMTAHALTGDRELCLQAGMDDYIAKPIEAELLFLALSRAEGGATKSTQSPVYPYQITRLIELCGQEQAAQMLAEFQAEVLKLLAAINDARRRSDSAALFTLIQSLKRASQAFGAQQLVQLCTELEGHVTRGDLLSADPLLKGTKAAILLSCAELEQLLQQSH